VQIQFPWGSLLHAAATGDQDALSRLIRICAPDATLKIIISLDPARDCSEMDRLNISRFDLKYVREVLIPRYERAGFHMKEPKNLTPAEVLALNSSWAKRVHSANRHTIVLTGKA